MRITTCIAVVLLLATTLHAQTDDGLERVLLPIAVAGAPGAHGSQWSSDLWVHVRRPEGMFLRPLRLSDVTPIHGSERVPVWWNEPGQQPGLFLDVETAALEQSNFNLRVRDLTREHETWGTEIPVVRERDFRANTISLLPAAIGGEFRSTLRVYAGRPGSVSIVVRRLDTRTEVFNGMVAVNAPNEFRPAYAEIPLDALVNVGAETILSVDVIPMNGLPIWAFISTTHNETQHFTTVTPQ